MGSKNPSGGSPFGIIRLAEVMTNGDHEGQIFLSHPHTNNGFFFLLTIKYRILCLKMLLEVPEYAHLRHDMVTSL